LGFNRVGPAPVPFVTNAHSPTSASTARGDDCMRSIGRTVGGWLLVVLGAAALVLPGPGLLLLLAGLVVLSQEYEWAERRVEPVRQKAYTVARSSVSSNLRILASALASLAIVAVGIVWWLDPEIPEIGPVGPDLPLGGWSTGSGIVISGLAALALVVYSVRRFRGKP
jgi:Putative transmembrane protein (PGPGW)